MKRFLLTTLLCLAPLAALAQVPIGALPNASLPLSGSELMVLSQNGASVKATVSQAVVPGNTIANNTVLGNVSGGTAQATALNATQVQTLLGLGTAAYVNTGTSGGTVPLLNGINTWSALQTLTGGLTVSAGATTVGNMSVTGALGVTGVTTLTTPLAISSGGTSASTAQGARLAILPSITGNAGKALTVNGGETDFTYTTLTTGTVTSVGLAGTAAEITVTGATPITSSGSWTLSLPTALTFTGKTITGGAFTGGTWNNGIIGGSTPAAITSTSLTATGAVALSPANANVVLSPTGTGVVTIAPATAGSINNMVIGDVTPLAITGTTITANTAFRGTDLGTGSTSSLNLTTSGGTQLRVVNTASAVNFWQFTGNSLGNAPFMTAGGSDTNISMTISSKGSGLIALGSASGVNQVLITHTASANRTVNLTGSNGGNPTIGASAGSLAVSSALVLSQTTLLATSVSLTDGAGAQAGTLLNAPTAGNPTKWIPINDNGTTRYIPAW